MTTLDSVLKRMRERAPVYNYIEEAQEELGAPGAMLHGAKIAPEGQEVYWNACVFNEREEQIWHGDFNLTRDRDKLQRLADRVGTIHLTPEQPFRFDGFKAGKKSYAGERIVTFSSSPNPS